MSSSRSATYRQVTEYFHVLTCVTFVTGGDNYKYYPPSNLRYCILLDSGAPIVHCELKS
jgi:hypothetical protein